MKTIGLVLHPFKDTNSAGLGRSIYNLAREIIAQDTKNQYIIFTKGEKESPQFEGDNWRVIALPEKPLWLDRYLYGYRNQLDAFVFFTPVAPLFWKPKRMLVVVHDMGAWVLNARTLKHRIIQFVQKRTLKRATRIVAVSETTKTNLTQFMPEVKGKISVVHNGFDAVVSGEASEVTEIQKPYFLFLGVLKSRKNPLGVVKAFEIFKKKTKGEHSLVFAGSYDPEGDVVRAVSESPYKDNISMLGRVSDSERSWLYKNAHAFVFPSLFEGFGLPILEAMSVGVPVITSEGGATEEVSGGAAVLVDPKNSDDIAEGMSIVSNDEKKRAKHIEDGLEHVKTFSWRKAGGEYVTHINAVLHI